MLEKQIEKNEFSVHVYGFCMARKKKKQGMDVIGWM